MVFAIYYINRVAMTRRAMPEGHDRCWSRRWSAARSGVRLPLRATSPLAVTSATIPVAGLPPALVRPAHRPAHRRSSQPLGIRTMTSPPQSRQLMRAQARTSSCSAATTSPGATARTSARPPKRLAVCRHHTASSPILGNHDDDHDMPAALTAKACSARDARTPPDHHATNRSISSGIRYWTKRLSDIAHVDARRRRARCILLAHDPRRLTEAAALDVPLVLSGPYPRRPGGASGVGRGCGAEISGGVPASPGGAARRCS